MEPKAASNDKFFIVHRGKSKKGFSRGCIGRVESESALGELTVLLYGGGSSAGTPKNRGVLRREDTCPLTRHQAQLLLYISSVSKRFELMYNSQLFNAICALSHNDVVVVRHRKGPLPGMVKNLMQIGKKENKDDLHMLGFEVDFVNSDQTLTSKKAATMQLFSAADIIQVIPSNCNPFEFHWSEGSGSLSKKSLSRIQSMPNMEKRTKQDVGNLREHKDVQKQRMDSPQTRLEVGSMVEVVSDSGVTVYGVIRWLGIPEQKTKEWAGIELDYEVNGCSDGKYGGRRYFTCEGTRALFLPITKCSPDSRFFCSSTEKHKLTEILSVPLHDELEEDAPPVPESEALSLFLGRMKGIQGHINSCYLDATLFSLFSTSVVVDRICQKPADPQQPLNCTLRTIVNRLRRQGFVPAENVMNFRKQLGCDTFRTDEKDPEEFVSVLFQKVLCIEPLLKLRSGGEPSQGAYTLQIFLEKEQLPHIPTVQQLLDTSCISGDIKFETVPSCLIVQMPRFGNMYKMFSHIIPSMELDITDVLYNSPRECFICGRLAEFECPQCLPDRKLQPGRIKQFCLTCKTQVHSHPSRCSHFPRAVTRPADAAADTPVLRHTMQLFAVLCIQTSHYVSFVKYGPKPQSWVFFDSMADRCGDDQSGYNIPEIRACPELGDFLCQSEEELARSDPLQAPELVRRLLCDSYMLLYQSTDAPLSKPNNQEY